MGKKAYSKPLVLAEKFIPQNYIAACSPDQTYVTYQFWCNAGSGNYKVWLDSNNNGTLDSQDRQLTSNGFFGIGATVFTPCNEAHSVTVPKGQSIDNIFPKGFIWQYDYGLIGDSALPVRIWRGENDDDIHCTFVLDEEEFTISNPS